MTRRTKIWIIAAVVLVVYMVAAIVTGRLLHVNRQRRVAAAGRPHAPRAHLRCADPLVLPRPYAGRASDARGATCGRGRANPQHGAHAARRGEGRPTQGRAASPTCRSCSYSARQGSTKTTTVVRSGLEPELLGGEVMRGETVAPTKTANVWFAHGTVFAEAGGAVLAASENWRRFVRALRPRSLVAALTGKPQAPRLAVVCFGCDELLKAGNGEAVAAAGRALRERLGEASTELGVQLPTYVLFTKADAIPHFEAFVRNFSGGRIARTVRRRHCRRIRRREGTYAERVTPRLERAMHDIYRSLAGRRLPVLAREHAAEWKPAAYEFPREVRKLAPLVVEFLRELGKPSALQGKPGAARLLLHRRAGGVRQRHDAGIRAGDAPQAREVVGARSATGVFSVQQLAAAAAAAAAPSTPRTRKVPRWDFLPRLFREVILADDAAVRLTQGGERVGFLRRATLAGGAAFALLLSMAFAISYSGNRQLERQVGDAARGIAAISPNNVDFPPVDAMRRLDTLRAQIDTLSAYEHHGAPLSLRWGLYSGSSIYLRRARRVLRRLQPADVRQHAREPPAVVCEGFPTRRAPSDDYGTSYSLLKSYLITTTHPEKSTVDFLSPVLMKQWLNGRTLDSARGADRSAAVRHLRARAAVPKPVAADSADTAAVARGRAFLRQFAGSERIYQFMLAEANKASQPIQFNRKFPRVGAVSRRARTKCRARSRRLATRSCRTRSRRVDRFSQGESWVVGEGAPQVDEAKLVAELRARYTSDYIENWRRFLRSASIARYSSVRDASQKLTVLSGNQSPLLTLFSIASRNTNVAPDIASVFQPVQAVMPPADTTKLIGPGNQPYMSALVAFQTAVDQARRCSGNRRRAALGSGRHREVGGSHDRGVIHDRSTGTGAQHGPEAHGRSDQLRRALAVARRRRSGQRTRTDLLRGRAPHAGQVSVQSEQHHAGVDRRSERDAASGHAARSGRCTPKCSRAPFRSRALRISRSRATSSSSPSFVDMFNRLAAFSDVLFAGGTQDPKIEFKVKPLFSEGTNGVQLQLEGDVVEVKGNNLSYTRTIDWPATTHDARLSVLLGTLQANLVGPYQRTLGDCSRSSTPPTPGSR